MHETNLVTNNHCTTVTIIQLHIHVYTYHNSFIRTSLGGEIEKATSLLVAGEGLSAEPFLAGGMMCFFVLLKPCGCQGVATNGYP